MKIPPLLLFISLIFSCLPFPASDSHAATNLAGTYGIARMVAGFPSGNESMVLAGRGAITFNGAGSCSAALIDTEYGLDLSTGAIADYSDTPAPTCSYTVDTDGGLSLTFTGDAITYQGSVGADGATFNLAGADSDTRKKVMMLSGNKRGAGMSASSLNGTYGIARMVAGFPNGNESMVLAGRGAISFNGAGSCSAALIDTEYGLDLSTGAIADYSDSPALTCSYTVDTDGGLSLTFTGDAISYRGSVGADGATFNLAGADSDTRKKVMMLSGSKRGAGMSASSLNGTYGIARMVAGFPSGNESMVLAGRGAISFNGAGSCSAALIDTEYGLDLSTGAIADYSDTPAPTCSYTVDTNGGLSLTFTGDAITYQGSVGADGATFNLAGADSDTRKKVMMLSGNKVSPPTNSWEVTFTMAGNGSGAVNSNPAGISCSNGSTSGCSASFDNGLPVNFYATPSSDSVFGGWSGACSGTGNCNLTMDSAKAVTATFTATPKAKVGTKAFTTLQMAYDDNSTTTDSVIKLLEGTLIGDFTAGRSISVKLEGGYNAAYDAISTKTAVKGQVKIKAGTVRITGINVK